MGAWLLLPIVGGAVWLATASLGDIATGGFVGPFAVLLLMASLTTMLVDRLAVNDLDDDRPGLPRFGEGVSLAAALALVVVNAIAGTLGPLHLDAGGSALIAARSHLEVATVLAAAAWAAPGAVRMVAARLG